MIRTALEFIKKELDSWIADREQDPAQYAPNSIVSLKSVMLPDGSLNVDDNFHITVMLTGVEELRREGKFPQLQQRADKKLSLLNPPVELELFVLFVAHRTNYETALRDLSDVAGFFQANPVFDENHYPSLNTAVTDPATKPWQLIERLSFTMHSLSFEQQNNLWAMIGTKYMPSIMYKVRMLTVFETKARDLAEPVTELNFNED